jgi:hypothetical protein
MSKPKPKNPVGRPKGPVITWRGTVALEAKHEATAKRIGGGNVNKGVRAALDKTRAKL